jgi:hypothetical protein
MDTTTKDAPIDPPFSLDRVLQGPPSIDARTLMVQERDLSDFLARITGRFPIHSDSELTIGIEHEMFLNVGAEPCSHANSQSLFEALILRGWQVSSMEDFGTGPFIASIVPPYDAGTHLKFEHHPYLIEVAFDFSNDLFELESRITRTLSEIEVAAMTVGITISSSPFCCVGPDHPATRSEAALAKALRAYRQELLRKQGREVSPSLDNFSAVIAATQVQIGGLEWWTEPTLIPALYSLEPTLLGCSYICCDLSESPERSAARRWSGYAETLRGCPLVGFPDLEQWTQSSWINALTRTPTLGARFESAEAFLVSVRDLQIIRPRVFGTLEFRSDPAQSSVNGILAIAATRLACCVGVRHGYAIPGSFTTHRTSWWAAISGQDGTLPYTKASGLLERARQWLQSRGKGEETFLAPLHQDVTNAIASANTRDVLINA